MNIQEAKNAIGQPFKVTALRGGLLGQFDTILRVDDSGTIYGQFIEAYCEDCRFKEAQPDHLKKGNDQRLTDEG